MGKKKSVNSKAAAAKERKDQVKASNKARSQKAAMDAAWSDEGSTAKEKKKADAARKRAEMLKKRQEKKALEAKDALAMEKKKVVVKAQKRTVAELNRHREKEEEERAKQREIEEKARQRIVEQQALVTNCNHAIDDDSKWVSGIDSALEDLGEAAPEDKHPEKRMKARYNKFVEITMPIFKEQFPGLKHSQLKQKLWDAWQKSPDNPMRDRKK